MFVIKSTAPARRSIKGFSAGAKSINFVKILPAMTLVKNPTSMERKPLPGIGILNLPSCFGFFFSKSFSSFLKSRASDSCLC